MDTISVGILGATAYTGLELARILTRHAGVAISFVSSRSYAGQTLSAVFPELSGLCDQTLLSLDEAGKRDVDCLFSCLPHAVSAQYCTPFLKKGTRVIDLSADFRVKDPAVYKKWYEVDVCDLDALRRAAFGLPERYRDQIRTAPLTANPGCYPTSIMLPLVPLLQKHTLSMIIADSKSGVSGAGRALKLSSHFVEANENVTAYSIGHTHRHVSEIEQELSAAAGKPTTITFSPHLIPMSRGILSTIYFQAPLSAADCTAIVSDAYAEEPFARVRPTGVLPRISDVRGTNFCDIGFTGGESGQPLIAVSVIDNLLKGASGQAVQNMNIMFGFDERAGLC
jgi:N-acetyl-gamma-glutamyl-phosphate reductase